MERLVFNIKEHKLEELEKYGFNKSNNFYIYKNLCFCVYIDDLSFSYCNELYIDKQYFCVLYDLIKDGLIIKEKI